MCLLQSEPRRHLSINPVLIMPYLVVVNYINSVHILYRKAYNRTVQKVLPD